MINYAIDLTGLIISILGLILVLRSNVLERRSRQYFLWIFIILIGYAVSDLVSWLTMEKAERGWILVSKTGLFLASAFSGALIPLVAGFLLYSAGEKKAFGNRVFQMIVAVFVLFVCGVCETPLIKRIVVINDPVSPQLSTEPLHRIRQSLLPLVHGNAGSSANTAPMGHRN